MQSGYTSLINPSFLWILPYNKKMWLFCCAFLLDYISCVLFSSKHLENTLIYTILLCFYFKNILRIPVQDGILKIHVLLSSFMLVPLNYSKDLKKNRARESKRSICLKDNLLNYCKTNNKWKNVFWWWSGERCRLNKCRSLLQNKVSFLPCRNPREYQGLRGRRQGEVTYDLTMVGLKVNI